MNLQALGLPAMPAMPSIAPGGGGPSNAGASSGGGGGFDGSGWAINFGGQQDAVSTPQTVAYRTDAFGLPNASNTPARLQRVPAMTRLQNLPGLSNTYGGQLLPASDGGGGGGPVLLLAGVVIVALLLRH